MRIALYRCRCQRSDRISSWETGIGTAVGTGIDGATNRAIDCYLGRTSLSIAVGFLPPQSTNNNPGTTVRKFCDCLGYLWRTPRTTMVESAMLSRLMDSIYRDRNAVKSCRLRGSASLPVAQDGVGASAWYNGKSCLRVISSVFGRSPAANQHLIVFGIVKRSLMVTVVPLPTSKRDLLTFKPVHTKLAIAPSVANLKQIDITAPAHLVVDPNGEVYRILVREPLGFRSPTPHTSS